VLLLDHGQVIASGSPRDVIGTYQEIGRTRTRLEHRPTESTTLSGEATITAVTLLDGGGRQLSAFRTGSPVAVRIDYVVRELIPDAIFEVYVYSMIAGMYGPWCQLTTVTPEGDGMPLESRPGTVEFQVEEMSLLPGICYLSARIAHRDQPAGFAIDWRPECAMLRVNSGRPVRGTFYMPHRWRTLRPDAITPQMPSSATQPRGPWRHENRPFSGVAARVWPIPGDQFGPAVRAFTARRLLHVHSASASEAVLAWSEHRVEADRWGFRRMRSVQWRLGRRHGSCMFTLTVRRVSVRYMQSVVGPSWAVLQPLLPGRPASPNGGRQPCLPGSSRPFGEGTDSPSRTLDEVIYTWVAFQLRHSEYDSPGLHIRNDLHAARDVEAPEGAERGEVPRAGPQ
jgi:Wzt C-terminal domain